MIPNNCFAFLWKRNCFSNLVALIPGQSHWKFEIFFNDYRVQISKVIEDYDCKTMNDYATSWKIMKATAGEGGGGGGGLWGSWESLIRGGSALRSSPLPFYIPFWQKRYPVYIPFIEKRYPFNCTPFLSPYNGVKKKKKTILRENIKH